jgi:hypothetical protein
MKEDLTNMENPKNYFEHPGKVVETDSHFAHVMAITLDPRTNNREGIVRCIVSRSGDVALSGNVDRSELHLITGDSLEHFKIGERLKIKNEDAIITGLGGDKGDFIGLEDPDIWIDEKSGLMHVYFTIPIRFDNDDYVSVSLGHAVGKDLSSLEMTAPALAANEITKDSAKEVSIAPVNRQGVRLNLFEGWDHLNDEGYSTVRIGIAEDMGKPWKYGGTVFHPAEHSVPWAIRHASPGPLFSRDFIDVGEGKLLGLMNGRAADEKVGDEKKHGMFSVGLFIYDYENGKIDWVSPESFIQDSEARNITFASQFVQQGKGSGILYAHIDDSFVRAYTLNADTIKGLLP